ncbi:kinesin family member 21A [Cryptococcus bacillisporus CA1873]|uniref:Kinesin family member 21A n=1 Tax=Cryptococcus bacillisporus CA1873 TaxID=1296111 RepID=A0ABR5BDU0_CRYGA|nr:kinesin family member 21A [Cryptococcus bacillisporus CA1873]|eukprot:KIR67308.1 kinesin family member 21A [Cryptococcus gattii CA1873]
MSLSRRQSIASSSPLSPSAITTPNSSAGQHPFGYPRSRLSSDVSSISAAAKETSNTPENRNVKVVLRIRPSDPDDPSVPPRFRSVLVHPISKSDIRVDVDPAALAGHGTGIGSGGKKYSSFSFDHVLGESAQQTDLYQCTAGESVEEFMKGHNVTFLAYGQTSSGKSYSMGTTGDSIDYSGTELTPRTGLIPRIVQTIFERAEDNRQKYGPGASWEARLSFLELYNEEIIDLLSGAGISISIREERDGRIVWSGVREVSVRSLSDVMKLLQEGSTRRKTGETTMNATSSRSHAIFSITLVQKRSSSALPVLSASGSETPTRQLRRPSSMIGLPGSSLRSPIPSNSRGGPPSSFSRMTPSRPQSAFNPLASPEKFTVITSKFNMVDLAGSERLKRTAAQGDRMKEGISINVGLLALGNVISALSDPVKSRGHIPYRDSKLTRMLQDSIGGNALTTMIACVSPIEANIGETLNTIKYASRARNIRNSAKVNQVEAGWDDVEYLQNIVLKLRKQVVALEGEGKVGMSEDALKQSEKLARKLAELQREHTELYDRYLGKCHENMRLSSELKSPSPDDGDALTRSKETVEPAILEYEKVVFALNQQLDDLRAEITLLNEMSEEQSRHLQDARERQLESEADLAELRARMAKLADRNASNEAFIQDLEAKLEAYAAKEDTHTLVVTELKKEIVKLRENGASSSKNVSELEARLATSETLREDLATLIEKSERDATIHGKAFHDLETHMIHLEAADHNKHLLEELAQKNSKITELEDQLKEKVHCQFERRGSELYEADEAEQSMQKELDSKFDLSDISSSSNARPVRPRCERSDASAFTLVNDDAKATLGNGVPLNQADRESSQLEQLKKELEDLSAKYSDSEARIADLTAKLSGASHARDVTDDMVEVSQMTTEKLSRTDNEEEDGVSRGNFSESNSILGSDNKQTLMRRTSLPLLDRSGISVEQGFRGGRGYSNSKRNRLQSLSWELSSARSSATSPRAMWSLPVTKFHLSSPMAPARPAESSRSSQSLEAELRFIHRVIDERDKELRDKEAYILHLETQLETAIAHDILSHKPSAKINVEAGVMPQTLTSNIQIYPGGVVPKVLEEEEAAQDFVSREMIESRVLKNEEQQRQLKMKADQALFELSRVRDECALERQNGGKQISELTERNGRLECVKVELEKVNAELVATCAELRKRNDELEQMASGGEAAQAVSAVPGREAEREKEKIKEMTKLQEEKVKVNDLALELGESQKMANNLRARLDEARQEMTRMSKISREEQSRRDDLLHAGQAQVAGLKMQLERAVDKKVVKKRLGCF